MVVAETCKHKEDGDEYKDADRITKKQRPDNHTEMEMETLTHTENQ